MTLIICSKYTAMLLCMKQIYGAPIHIFTASCDVKHLKGKPLFFKVNTFQFHTFFMPFNPFTKCTFIPLLVNFLYNVFCCISDIILVRKFLSRSFNIVLIKQSPQVQNPGCIEGGGGAARSQHISPFICKTSDFIRSHCL